MRRRVAVFSATRADLWPLTPLLRRMVQDPRVDPTLLATGAHLSSAYGATLREIGDWVPTVPLPVGLGEDDAPVALLQVARARGGAGRTPARHAPT